MPEAAVRVGAMQLQIAGTLSSRVGQTRAHEAPVLVPQLMPAVCPTGLGAKHHARYVGEHIRSQHTSCWV